MYRACIRYLFNPLLSDFQAEYQPQKLLQCLLLLNEYLKVFREHYALCEYLSASLCVPTVKVEILSWINDNRLPDWLVKGIGSWDPHREEL